MGARIEAVVRVFGIRRVAGRRSSLLVRAILYNRPSLDTALRRTFILRWLQSIRTTCWRN